MSDAIMSAELGPDGEDNSMKAIRGDGATRAGGDKRLPARTWANPLSLSRCRGRAADQAHEPGRRQRHAGDRDQQVGGQAREPETDAKFD
jgi:hypothetical protein